MGFGPVTRVVCLRLRPSQSRHCRQLDTDVVRELRLRFVEAQPGGTIKLLHRRAGNSIERALAVAGLDGFDGNPVLPGTVKELREIHRQAFRAWKPSFHCC